MIVLTILRRTRGLSQGELGRALGIRQKTLSAYERGMRPTAANLMKLAAYFHIDEQNAGTLMREVPGSMVEDLPRAVIEHVQGGAA